MTEQVYFRKRSDDSMLSYFGSYFAYNLIQSEKKPLRFSVSLSPNFCKSKFVSNSLDFRFLIQNLLFKFKIFYNLQSALNLGHLPMCSKSLFAWPLGDNDSVVHVKPNPHNRPFMCLRCVCLARWFCDPAFRHYHCKPSKDKQASRYFPACGHSQYLTHQESALCTLYSNFMLIASCVLCCYLTAIHLCFIIPYYYFIKRVYLYASNRIVHGTTHTHTHWSQLCVIYDPSAQSFPPIVFL